MSISILPIVEGHAEVQSVPLLLRRVLGRMNLQHAEIARPFRVKRNRVTRPGELERAIEQSVRDRKDIGGILVLLDSDDDCPAVLGPDLLTRARQSTDLPVAVVFAVAELEGWFLGAKESLRGVRGILQGAAAPHDPESVRGAKERLTENMQQGRRYLDVDDQPALAEHMDLDSARRQCPSFEKFLRDVHQLVSRLRPT